MAGPLPVTDAMIAREFRLQRCRGSAVDAITNPLIRRCLALGAEARAAREAAVSPSTFCDAKSRAANDND
ncbi:hypothetical protein LGM75_23945 [Burkholderia multivorans]|uniref:hypothetical protein n=1 Tax=Burkholderia multivorans TaxID=87883 RepID=UPI001C24420F|nr:hypothetical protein [Burkholderia multivorans]MBU9468330.1 hypothetical protein [Burkholderia multivorans]MCA8129408.1 hypothetical protein [Burkholderia multivorans]